MKILWCIFILFLNLFIIIGFHINKLNIILGKIIVPRRAEIYDPCLVGYIVDRIVDYSN